MIESISLKFCLFNVENLFLMFDEPVPPNFEKLDESEWQKLSTSVYDNKPLFKLRSLARTLIDLNADVVMLCEVGGLESLKNFNTLFLNNNYSPILIEGNSDRNIDVGYLVKKNSPFYFDLFTHKNRDLQFLYPHEKLSALHNYPVKKASHKLSRDCAELRLFKKKNSHPFLIILLTHLKSPLDPERIDPHGTERRTAELLTCLEIYKELKAEFPSCHILFAGDFNGQASFLNTDSEFKPLYETTQLQDVLEVAGIPFALRHTFFHVKSGLRSEGRQIDYCFIPQELFSKLVKKSTFVASLKDEFGTPLKKPETLEQKLSLASDHYPLVFELEKIPV